MTLNLFAQPAPDAPNPYRANPAPLMGARYYLRSLPGVAVPRTSGSASVATPTFALQLVPMDGMTMYDSDAGLANPFAKRN